MNSKFLNFSSVYRGNTALDIIYWGKLCKWKKRDELDTLLPHFTRAGINITSSSTITIRLTQSK